jgi:mRNA interferase RelE/StbE
MPYAIIWSAKAAKQLKALDRSTAKRICSKVGQLTENPEKYVQRLVASPYYKIRIGDYSVIIDIQSETLGVLKLKVGHRSKVYDR